MDMRNAEDLRWWLKREPHEIVMRRARDISAQQEYRAAADEVHLRLYSVTEWRGVYGARRRWAAQRRDTPKRLSLNVVRNCVNSAKSMICRARPYVSFLTDGADYRGYIQTRKRERTVQAHFMRERIHETSQDRVQNGIIFGTGATIVVRDGAMSDGGRLRYENVLPGELLVDDQEGIARNPPCMYRAQLVDRLTLAAKYPEHEKAILNAAPAGASAGADSATQILAVTAWHFRTTNDAKHDGVECLCVDGATLYCRPYRWPRFPGTVFRWEVQPLGFHGTGVPAELIGIQYEINALLRMVQESAYFGGNVRIFVEKGSGVAQSHLTNSLRIPVVEYRGQPPIVQAMDLASPQIFQHLQYLEQRAYNVTGISQLDAQSQTPFASMSGRARLVHSNNESLRFKATVERYENGFVELAEATLWACSDDLDENGDATITFRGKERLEQIKLSDIALEDGEDLDIERWSSSQLAHTPGARMEQVDFLVANGYVDRRRALPLMDIGDIRAETDLAMAPYNLIDEMIARILEDGEPQSPTPYMDLEYGLERVQLEIQRCDLRPGTPIDRLDMLREFREQIVDIKINADKAQAEQAMAQQQGGAPPAGPAPGADTTGAPTAPPFAGGMAA